MAELKKSVLGKVSGTVGDITFRQRRGKNVIGVRPRPFIPGDNLPSVERWVRFALSAKLAQTINLIPALRLFWLEEIPADMSRYNNMIAVNFHRVRDGSLTELATIMPSRGFDAAPESITITEDAVTVILKPLGAATGIDVAAEPNVRLVAVLYVSKPSIATLDQEGFGALTSADQPLTLEAAMSFSISPGRVESQLIANYQEKKLLIAVITLDTGNVPVRYSNTM